MDLTILPAGDGDLDWANDRYRSIDFVPSTPADELVVAWVGPERVGVGRVVPVAPGVGELGGMYVAPTARGRGVADTIVRNLLATTRCGTLFCIPFSDLTGIYQRCGFRRNDRSELPPAIVAKLALCADRYDRPVSVLCWDRE